jgi:organic radical activating enzyme
MAMMTYFLLNLSNKCNKACSYCVNKEWLNNPNFPDMMTSSDFINFLEKEMNEGDTVELTGGEPTLFPNLLELLDFLKAKKAKVIMRTNGYKLGQWRKTYLNMIVVLAKHNTADEPFNAMKNYLLEMDIVELGKEERKKQDPNSQVPKFATDEVSSVDWHGYERSLFVTPDGKIRPMPCFPESSGNAIKLAYRLNEFICLNGAKCPYMLGAWNLVSRLGI